MGFQVESDSCPLMHQLARMAGIPEGRIRRMVLVLDASDVPRLYTECYINHLHKELLTPTQLAVSDEPVVINIPGEPPIVMNDPSVVDTTTQLANKFRTKALVSDPAS